MTNRRPEADDLDDLVPDRARLAAWFDEQGLGPPEAPLGLRRLPGGTANVIVEVRRGDERWALRRPPRTPRPHSDRIMVREHRVLRALADTAVPHPRATAVCDDHGVLGVNFHVMEHVDGTPPAGFAPPFHGLTAKRSIAEQFVDALGALANVDHVAVGLADFGRPEGYLERQVDRWLGELASYSELDGYAGPDWEGLDVVAGWLRAHVPAMSRPGILHGDYHLGNVLVVPGAGPSAMPHLAAIVDWEQSTVGDPLVDLGWVLATWPEVGEDPGPLALVGDPAGLPTRAELVDRYAAVTGRDTSAIGFHVVLARFKFACILEGQHARAVAGVHDPAVGAFMAEVSRHLVALAAEQVRHPGRTIP